MDTLALKKRILILGGGFGGVYTARHLDGAEIRAGVHRFEYATRGRV